MTRSSRHKSHRQHRRSSRDVRERSESEEEEVKEKQREDRDSKDSRDSEQEKRKSLSFLQSGEERSGVDGDNGRKHGGRSVDLFVVVERWSGDKEEEEEKKQDFGGCDGDRMGNVKSLGDGWKEKSSRKHDGEGKEKGGDRDEYVKRKSDKESNRSGQHGDGKERVRERASDGDRERLLERCSRDRDIGKDGEHEPEKDKEHTSEKERDRRQEKDRERRMKRGREELTENMDREHALEGEVAVVASHKSSEVAGRKSGSRTADGDYPVKGSTKNTEGRVHEELPNSDFEKDSLKKNRKKDQSGDKDKLHEDDRDIYDRKLSSTDVHVRRSNYKDEKYREDRQREKYHEDFDRDERFRNDKHRDGRSSRDRASDRSDGKHKRDENKPSDNYYKRSRIEENERESSPYVDKYSERYKDNREKKRFSDDNDVLNDLKPRNTKEPRIVENDILNRRKVERSNDRDRSDSLNLAYSTDNKQLVKSPYSSSHVFNSEYSSKEAESTRRKQSSQQKQHVNATWSGDVASASVADRILDSESVERKSTQKDPGPDDSLVDNSVTSPQNQITPRSGSNPSPIQLSEKPPTSTSGRSYSNRAGAVRCLDVDETEQRVSYPRDGREYSARENKEQDFPHEKQEVLEGNSQMEPPNGDSIPVGSLSFNRSDHFSSCSPSPLRSSSSARHGLGSPVVGSDGDRFQAAERKCNNRYKRVGDLNTVRGPGNAMKGVLTWPSPVTNGFIPFQHGPPPGGFYPVVHPFPGPPMFGVRPSMDMNQSGNPFHMNEDRFSNHSRPFGWPYPADDPFPPNLQGWDGNNIFRDNSYMHCRSDWEQKSHLMSNTVSEVSVDTLKGQNGSMNPQLLSPYKESASSKIDIEDEVLSGQSGHQTNSKQLQLDQVAVNGSGDTLSAKKDNDSDISRENKALPSKPVDASASFCSTCLSKLDISVDLARPELYDQTTKILETKGDTTRNSNTMPQDNVEGVRCAVRSFSQAKDRPFSTLPDDIFQRAMSLYRKETEVKVKTSSSIIQSKEVMMDLLKNSDIEKIELVENVSSPVASAAAKGHSSRTEEDDNTLNEIQADLCDVPTITHDEQSDTTYNNAAGCAEGASQGCEALMPECRVNLSRIHHSPESTH